MRAKLLRKCHISIVSIILIWAQAKAATLIVDLDGVLLGQKSLTRLWEIGPKKLLLNGFYNPFTLKSTLFEFLNLVEPFDLSATPVVHDGMRMPQIMCDWLTGAKTEQEIKLLIKKTFEERGSFFSTSAQKSLIKESIDTIFTAERFIKPVYIVKEGLQLLKRCHAQKDSHGKRLNTIYILSNWDRESFDLLVESSPKIQKMLKYCDGLVISGHVGLMKPDPAIFEYLFETYGINPDTDITVFIDDQKANINAAKNLRKRNLHCLRCKNFNYSPITKELKRLSIILD